MSDTTRRIWCLVEGENTPFSVIVPSTIIIEDLKKEIIIKKKYLSQRVDDNASNLVLWKPTGIPVKPSNSLAKRVRDQGPDISKFADELDPVDLVAEVFPNQTSPLSHFDHLDVIIRLPALSWWQHVSSLAQTLSTPVLGKRSRAADDSKLTDLPWLKELHAKIWNRKCLKPLLFRKVEVTQAHYAALERDLKKVYSDRDSPGYDGYHDVLNVKLNLLRSLPPADSLSQQHPDDSGNDDDDDDDSEGSNEDDPEIKSLFPSILSYLDLSALRMKERIPERLPMPLLLRQEYDNISKLIKERPQNSGGSIIISGQPGTGKTAYLYLRMIETMIEGHPFLYQAIGGTVYHVGEKGVDAIQSWSSEEAIVAFIDGDKGDYEAKDFLIRRSVQFIVATSPKGAYKKWTKQTGHFSTIIPLAVKLWSYKEVLLTGIFLQRADLLFKLLRESTSYFGDNPRQCFEASTSAKSLRAKKAHVMYQIRTAASMGSDHIMELLLSAKSGRSVSDLPYTVFQISPVDTDAFLPGCKFEAVSGWVLDLLLQGYRDRRADKLADFYFNLSVLPEAASLRGHLFERQVLNFLGGIRAECNFSIRRLTDSNQMTWVYRGPIRRFTFEESTLIEQITDAVQKKEPRHFVPLARNFTAVNSILYDPNDLNAVLTCIQITRNENHPIVVEGLKQIQRWLRLCTPLGDLCPTESRPWRFLFVVPSGMMSTFTLQELDRDTARGVWAGKVDQYVLGLDEEIIFREISTTISQQGEPQAQVQTRDVVST